MKPDIKQHKMNLRGIIIGIGSIIGVTYLLNLIIYLSILYISIFILLVYNVNSGFYQKGELKHLKKQGLKSRMRIEEIELASIYVGIGGLLWVGIKITNFQDLLSNLYLEKAIMYGFIYIFFLVLIQWVAQNQHNLKVLGDQLDEL